MDPGSFVQEKLAVSVPWDDLVQQSNLQKILLAIVQRLDRYDRTLAPSSAELPLSVIPTEELKMYRERIDVLENISLQARIDDLKKGEGLAAVAADAKKKFNLANHVIPLTQLKGKVESFDVALQATAQQVDELNSRVANLATAFDKEITAFRKEFQVIYVCFQLSYY